MVKREDSSEPINIVRPYNRYNPSITHDRGQIRLAKPNGIVNWEPNFTNEKCMQKAMITNNIFFKRRP
ncbi:MAG TPA: hypothetical protein DIS98_12165 [Colwellia sp.]|nr:hypothetical protein [Colwellia sp.]